MILQLWKAIPAANIFLFVSTVDMQVQFLCVLVHIVFFYGARVGFTESNEEATFFYALLMLVWTQFFSSQYSDVQLTLPRSYWA